MKEKIKWSTIHGKTIETVCPYDTDGIVGVTFTDGSRAVIGIHRGWESCDDTVGLCPLSDLSEWGKLQVGWITREEFEAWTAAEREAQRQGSERAERQYYEKLKAKYEVKP